MIQPDRLTVKAAEALQQAAALARSKGNPVVNVAHLFYTLLQQDEGIVVPLLQKAGLNVSQLQAETEREIGRFPKQWETSSPRSPASCPACSIAPMKTRKPSAMRTSPP